MSVTGLKIIQIKIRKIKILKDGVAAALTQISQIQNYCAIQLEPFLANDELLIFNNGREVEQPIFDMAFVAGRLDAILKMTNFGPPDVFHIFMEYFFYFMNREKVLEKISIRFI